MAEGPKLLTFHESSVSESGSEIRSSESSVSESGSEIRSSGKIIDMRNVPFIQDIHEYRSHAHVTQSYGTDCHSNPKYACMCVHIQFEYISTSTLSQVGVVG